MYFFIDLEILFWLTILAVSFFLIAKKISTVSPTLFLPEVDSLAHLSQTSKLFLVSLPNYSIKLSFCFFLLAILDPQIRIHHPLQGKYSQLPKEGVAIYLVLDNSSSMGATEMDTKIAELHQFPTKLHILKDYVRNFIKSQPQALIGVISFARSAQILSPLTLSHESVLNDLEKLQIVSKKSENGSAIGYAIFKTAALFAATKQFAKEIEKPENYQIRDMAMIVISDGFQEVHPDDTGKRLRAIDIEEAARFAKEQNVRIYFVSVSKEMEKQKFADYRNMLIRAVELTGGHFYQASNAQNLQEIFAKIDQLEKSKVLIPEKELSISSRKYSFYPWLIILGMTFLLFSIFMQTTVIKRIP